MKRRDNEDARTWASSIGSTTIDIRDKRAPGMPTAPLRAPLVPIDKLAELQRLLSTKEGGT